MSFIVRVRNRLPVGVARVRYSQNGDTHTIAQAIATGQAVGIIGERGPAGNNLTDGSGVSIIGDRIDLNIAELPLAP